MKDKIWFFIKVIWGSFWNPLPVEEGFPEKKDVDIVVNNLGVL